MQTLRPTKDRREGMLSRRFLEDTTLIHVIGLYLDTSDLVTLLTLTKDIYIVHQSYLIDVRFLGWIILHVSPPETPRPTRTPPSSPEGAPAIARHLETLLGGHDDSWFFDTPYFDDGWWRPRGASAASW